MGRGLDQHTPYTEYRRGDKEKSSHPPLRLHASEYRSSGLSVSESS